MVSMLIDKTVIEFAKELSSSSPTPGGGAASAYTGLLSISLAMMVTNLTLKNKSYEAVHKKMQRLLEKGEDLKDDLQVLIDEDAKAFENLMAAYRLPKDEKAVSSFRSDEIAKALVKAVDVPFEIAYKTFEVYPILKMLLEDGNKNAITDVGASASLANAAIKGALLNVYINIKSFKDYNKAEELRTEALELEKISNALAKDIEEQVKAELL